MLNRRTFLGVGTAATLGLGSTAARSALTVAEAEPVGIRRYVPLGNTGLTISDISFGSSRSADPKLIHHALARGVTYFDTAESYRFGAAEEAMGEGLRGNRDKVVLASKTKARASAKAAEIMQALEGSLKRLKTDYLDIYYLHSVNAVERIQNDEWSAFTERAKEQGKIRFRGMSGHGSQLTTCLDYALDHDLAEVILVAFNFGQDPDFLARLRNTFNFVDLQPELPARLERAKEKGIGVIAMKTLMGARVNDMRPHETPGGTFAQAAFRWVLSTGKADALIVSMTDTDQIDEYVGASGDPKMTDADFELLDRYVALQSDNYCRHGCDACEAACPEGVPIAEVLRTRMYDTDYADHALAKADYGRLETRADACLDCSHQACANACPFGLEIPTLTRDAATRLG
jgi:predicted aldo/keto reductase-like oxidoreductase